MLTHFKPKKMNLFIKAKFSSACAETGKKIKKDDLIFYDRTTKKPYCEASNRFKDIAEMQSTAQIVEDQENAYFDNFCLNNNI